MTSGSVILGGSRTPIGKLMGGLSSLTAAQLGSAAISSALQKTGVRPDQVDYVIMGQVIQAGAGQNPARTAALGAEIPGHVPAITVNKVCLSGLSAIAYADQLIRAGECELVVAGGMESMSNAPHLLPGSRKGFTYGDTKLVDSMAYDALFDQATQQSMGALTESCNTADTEVSRAEQDQVAALSHERAAAAWENGVFDEEVTPVQVPQRKGDPLQVSRDEGIREGTTAESLGRLRPAFDKQGTITAASASQISDGACAVIVTTPEKARELGLTPLAQIGAYGMVAGPDSSLQLQPANAIAEACRKQGISPESLDLVEINEAFAAVGAASARQLGLAQEKLNVNGGAIALGHPVGMSGARLVLHLALELSRRGGGTGAAGLCGGGGQGDALILTV
ncbi:acetyl-CoA C-acetyltransferase [Nesterenkonia sp. E16_7]|uniref:acetyl-CoA C-acetyltransferase n=1 Tax=unclassified Nesterenkonia TaxID=2629769 RepID=UPI001A92F6AC|nr:MULTISPECIES: acetyl-CoA C-acetyltransferase [unclassified Nesterenkonia]MBO0594488.1 acetyl-CoA C-acetyltransferase [Nesterenkonia sp. E16_10]MBO0598803.1 acetyl-CoA C-acetyltransferase [Nesterenkonia sp. E16_7]